MVLLVRAFGSRHWALGGGDVSGSDGDRDTLKLRGVSWKRTG